MKRRFSFVAGVLACSCWAANTVPASAASELQAKARAAYAAGDWAACAEQFARASRAVAAGVDAESSYNAACCHARAGDLDAAFSELERAIEGGFHDVEHMRVDADLSGLHDDARWKDALARAEAALVEYRAGVNAELLELYERDQADRSGDIDWSEVTPRDRERRERVRGIVAAGGARVADDFFHAAMVFQHGEDPEEFKQAHEWAVRAVELDPEHGSARWLAAAAEDRYLMNLGKPQKYGTQYRRDPPGPWYLYPVDPSVTDEERAKWNVPPLSEALAHVEQMNATAADAD